MANLVKIIEVIGTSEESWQHAADVALEEAMETLEHISGIQVEQMSANIEAGQVTSYRTTLKVAFAVERTE